MILIFSPFSSFRSIWRPSSFADVVSKSPYQSCFLFFSNPLRNIFLTAFLRLIGGLFMCLFTSWKLTVLAATMIGPVVYLTGVYAKWSKSFGCHLWTVFSCFLGGSKLTSSTYLFGICFCFFLRQEGRRQKHSFCKQKPDTKKIFQKSSESFRVSQIVPTCPEKQKTSGPNKQTARFKQIPGCHLPGRSTCPSGSPWPTRTPCPQRR